MCTSVTTNFQRVHSLIKNNRDRMLMNIEHAIVENESIRIDHHHLMNMFVHSRFIMNMQVKVELKQEQTNLRL